MPTFFRKRPGNKNFKANVTQNGLSSFTVTNAAKKGGLRLNYNTKRGFSFSIPGTGISWRSKNYAKHRQSIAQKRGYDLRTKEGKAKKEQDNVVSGLFGNLLVISVISGALFYFTKDKWASRSVFFGLLIIIPFISRPKGTPKKTNSAEESGKELSFVSVIWGSLLFAWYFKTIWGGVVVFSALVLSAAPVLRISELDENGELLEKKITPLNCYLVGLFVSLPLWYYLLWTFEELILSTFAIGSIILMIIGGRFGVLWTLFNSAILVGVSISYTDVSPLDVLAKYSAKIFNVI